MRIVKRSFPAQTRSRAKMATRSEVLIRREEPHVHLRGERTGGIHALADQAGFASKAAVPEVFKPQQLRHRPLLVEKTSHRFVGQDPSQNRGGELDVNATDRPHSSHRSYR